MVTIVNVNTGATAEVSEPAARRRIASGRWRKVDTIDPQTLVDDHTRDELDQLATDAGLDPSEFRTKSDVAAAIAGRTSNG